MYKFLNRYKKVIPVFAGLTLFLCAGLSASLVFPSSKNDTHNFKNTISESKNDFQNSVPEIKNAVLENNNDFQNTNQKYYVYVTGAVVNPGVYEIPEHARIFHAIEAAGGFNNFAAQDSLNLAEDLNDGEHIHVLTKNEFNKQISPSPTPAPGVYIPDSIQNSKTEKQESLIASKNNFFIMDTTPVAKTSKNNVKSGKTTGKTSNSKVKSQYEKVDVNHASLQELEKLKGVGPALAKRIYEYRQTHGSFKSVEELVNVKGIGAAKLKAMKEQIIIR